MSNYYPPRPTLPGDLPFEPPAPPPAPDNYAPVPTPPPIGPCGKNPDTPVMRPVPPVPSPIEGTSLYESMSLLTSRVNECIEQWNIVQRNNYEYLRQGVAIARANDVYYDNHEVSFTQGYDTTEGCEYALVTKKAVDHCGRPIHVKLVPAFRNSSNPGVTQPIFDASFVESANVIVTAVPVGSETWGGPALWNGNPVPGSTVEGAYVYGFTRRGALRYFPVADLSDTSLVQQGMYNAIGGCTPIIYDGKLLDGVESMTNRMAVTAIGFNAGNGDVFFFSCSAQNQPGMGIASVARVLQSYGSTVAVVTSATANAGTVTQSEGMLYMGQMTTDPNQAIEPANLAYWVISKKPFFKNAFQKEVADLVQTTGQNAWRNYLLGVQIQSFDDRIADTAKGLSDEIRRATEAEEQLRSDLQAETDRATLAEAGLKEDIDAEVKRATEAEAAETNRAIARENELDAKIDAETTRAKTEEANILTQLSAEKLRATTRENEIQDALNGEIQARIAADNDLINAINQEVLARQAADTELGVRIDKVKADLSLEIFNLETKVNNIIAGTSDLPYLKLTGGTMTGPVAFTSSNTITVGRGPTADLEVATKRYVDDAVAAGSGGPGGGDVTKEYVDQQVNTLQQQITDKVSKSGDTMSGDLNMAKNKIVDPVLSSADGVSMSDGAGGPGRLTNVANPVEGTDAVNLSTLKSEVQSAVGDAVGDLSGDYLALSGGDMSGDINMTKQSTIKFYDTKTRNLVMPIALTDQELMGSVYNDDTAMVVKSETGQVALKGTDVTLSTGAGSPIAISGATAIMREKDVSSSAIMLQQSQVLVSSQTLAVGQGNTYNGAVKAGSLILSASGGIKVATIIPHNGHLDINVANTNGEVYVNKDGTTGGTGAVNLSKIASPNDLTLSPAGSVNVLNSRIMNVADPVEDGDAVNFSTVKNAAYPEDKIIGIINKIYLNAKTPDQITHHNFTDCAGNVTTCAISGNTNGYVSQVIVTESLIALYLTNPEGITTQNTIYINVYSGTPYTIFAWNGGVPTPTYYCNNQYFEISGKYDKTAFAATSINLTIKPKGGVTPHIIDAILYVRPGTAVNQETPMVRYPIYTGARADI